MTKWGGQPPLVAVGARAENFSTFFEKTIDKWLLMWYNSNVRKRGNTYELGTVMAFHRLECT